MAVGEPLTVTVAVVTKSGQPFAPAIVYFIVYVPGVAPDGSMLPVTAFTIRPVDGDTE